MKQWSGHILLVSWFVFLQIQALAQWEPAGVPFRVFEVFNIHSDTVSDALYFCGLSSLNNDFVTDDAAIPTYRDGQWDTVGVFNNDVTTVVRWGDTLVVGGRFTSIAGLPYSSIVGLVNGTWIPFGTSEPFSPYRFRILDGDLYAIGTHSAFWMGCRGIMKRVGASWESVGCLTSNSTIVEDLVCWRDTLYITGSLKFGDATTPKDIAYFDGSDWVPLGPGIRGGFGIGRSLAVYRDELYVSGGIPIGSNNAGHGIMRWDGSQFHPVGSGFQGEGNDYTYIVGASELEVHDDRLWACGNFRYAGNVPTPGIASWDGTRWCGLPLGPNVQVNSIEFFHDTLFAGCQQLLYGENVNCGVRFIGDSYSDTCSLVVGVAVELHDLRTDLRAYRCADGVVEVLGCPAGSHTVVVLDALGREVFQQLVVSDGSGPVRLALPMLPVGISYLRFGAWGTARLLGP